MTRMLTLLLAAILGATVARAEPTLAETPRRIVSFNLCADQLVLALADPGQIVGLSPYAADPTLSVVADKARAFPRLDWQAESTLALAPDLVLVGPNDRSATRRMLAKQGVRVVEVDLVSDLDAARRQIEELAGLVGHPERAAGLAGAFDAARGRLEAVRDTRARTALVVERGGYTQGPASLAAALAAQAGFVPPPNAPSGYGGFLPMERLLTLRPDVLFLKDPPSRPDDQGALYLTHPALLALYPPTRRIELPTRYSMCGGPALIAALDYLADALPRLKGD
jgi:iron complex transport system substrate-binding protein